LLKALLLGVAIAAALVLYFSLTLYVFPQSYQSIAPRRPEAVVTDVRLSAPQIELGQTLVVSVTGINRGEDADMQIVSVGFPNLTATSNIDVMRHNFTQTPEFISAGRPVGAEYTGETLVAAQYASLEAFSRPWSDGSIYRIDVQVRPESEGRFAIFIKSVAFPHSWDRAHWPGGGITDYQNEFVEVYYVQVTNP
jgi:hypothetical protein